MSTTRRNIRRTLAEPSDKLEGVTDVSPLKDSSRTTEDAGMGTAEELTSVQEEALLVGPPTPRNNIAFRDLSIGSETVENPTLEGFRQDAHALARTGLVQPSALEGLSLRLFNIVDGENKPYKNDAIGAALEPLIATNEQVRDFLGEKVRNDGSNYTPVPHAITINGAQTETYYPSGMVSREDALRATYLHELGHATNQPADVRDRLLAQSAKDTESKLPLDVRNAIIEIIDNSTIDRYSEAKDGFNYTTLVGEMHADAFMLASYQQFKGEDATKILAAAETESRVAQHTEALQSMGPEGTLITSHNSTYALKAYEDLLNNGEVASAMQQGKLIDVVDKSTYLAFLEEVSEKTLAKLNVHHLNDDGVPTPGLPDGVTREQVVTAALRNELSDPGSGFTLLMQKGLRAELAEDNVVLEPGGTRVNPFGSSKSEFKESVPSVPGFEALSTASNELRVRDTEAGASTTYRFGSAVENYLESRGLESPRTAEIESNPLVINDYYQTLKNRIEYSTPGALEHHQGQLGGIPELPPGNSLISESASEFARFVAERLTQSEGQDNQGLQTEPGSHSGGAVDESIESTPLNSSQGGTKGLGQPRPAEAVTEKEVELELGD